MSEENVSRPYSGALLGVIGASLVLALAGLIWSYSLSGKLTTQQAEIAEVKQQNVKLSAELRENHARLQVANEELGKSLGLTQKQLDEKAQEFIRRDQAQKANAERLEAVQKQTEQKITAVSGEVSSVKSDVGGVKSEVVKTQNDLANAVAQLTSIKGDLSSHSSLIARNRDELDVLRHKGDRNYFEFTIAKGEKKPVSTISLEVKKADVKKSRYTLVILADDKQYEKKDRNVNEPLQFYSGKNSQLYEIVINSVNAKNQISGYLSTPK